MMEEQKNIRVGNCPNCNGIIFNEADFKNEISFCMFCPHCRIRLKIRVKKIIIIEIEKISQNRE
ncbi:MAG: hypothetical protein COY83_00280 [Parcubacteria group bacterium CG_4_10_14_0_8_um_filter_48_154]|nr:MAG: hypothetical protein AUK21_00960 [Parcubacteria group bacterium CG2_30_48_51]PIY78361.1 MAG: hypothetical protein COY83_00280 [Parcubacteria group bacterium CG_4_10_14_0_8_um_filter_48_154]